MAGAFAIWVTLAPQFAVSFGKVVGVEAEDG
jgi:hypothetical protein